MKKRALFEPRFVVVQLIVLAAVGQAYARLGVETRTRWQRLLCGKPVDEIADDLRQQPLSIAPLYDDPSVVSDEALAGVLDKTLPRFARAHLKPNFVEHALRTWGVAATFADPRAVSGAELRDVLVDHGRFLRSWGDGIPPLLVDEPEGIAIRYDRAPGGSVHHDHWLASLTEAGAPLEQPVASPGHPRGNIAEVLNQALYDFRPDEEEVEWSVLAFGLWLPPHDRWTSGAGREVSFDLLANRLMRGDMRFGVCSGTHRVYSLAVLLRLDDESRVLSDDVRRRVRDHLLAVRQKLIDSQFDDGHWPANWSEGKRAREKPADESMHEQLIATGHHLEWLAIVPREFHPPHDRIVKAAEWCRATTMSQTEAEILDYYSFYSHVARALALWRKTSPAEFWQKWEASHPATQAADKTSADAQ